MITRTPKKKDEPGMFSDIPTAEIFADVDNENEVVADEKYDALAKQLADLQTRLSESERANMQLIQQPQWRSQITEGYVEVKPETIALPDPALDPDGYDRALAERNRIRADNSKRKEDFDANQRNEVKSKVENLWTSFTEKYPDMSEDQERIDFVASQLAKEAQKRGIDVERYMFITQDKFLDDVAKRYVKVFGEPEAADDDFEEAPRTRRNTKTARRQRHEDDDDGRSAGIFGGSENRSPSARRKDADEENGPNMIDDMQAMQRKTGFY